MSKTGYKVYFHRKADTDEIFYVGKGTRWRENITHNRNKHWHNVVRKHGFKVQIIARNLTNHEACILERKLISCIGRGSLVNYTDGGEGSPGYKHTAEALAKMQGRRLPTEHRRKLRQAKLKNPVRFWKNKQRPETTRRKISESLSNPSRKLVEKMLLDNVERKIISEQTGLPSSYIRGLASRMRRRGLDVEKKIN